MYSREALRPYISFSSNMTKHHYSPGDSKSTAGSPRRIHTRSQAGVSTLTFQPWTLQPFYTCLLDQAHCSGVSNIYDHVLLVSYTEAVFRHLASATPTMTTSKHLPVCVNFTMHLIKSLGQHLLRGENSVHKNVEMNLQ